MHVEKLVFGFVALIAGLVMYLGFSAKPFSGVESPTKLQETATQVSRSIKEDHWAAMATEEGRLVEPKFTRAAMESALAVDFRRFKDIPPQSNGGLSARRGDPTLLGPHDLEVKYYYGPIAFFRAEDKLEALEDAKKLEPPKPKPGDKGKGGAGYGSDYGGGGKGGGMSGSMGGMGGYTEGGMGESGFGGYGGVDSALAGKRRLSPSYDLGFRMGMRTFFENTGMSGATEGFNNMRPEVATTAPKKVVPLAAGCVVVTALAPHEELEAEYRKQFYEVFGYTDGRDTPNYVGFEAQRFEVTDPNKEINESDWQPLPDANPVKFKEAIKKLPGSCQEVLPAQWTDPNISMPILPFLLNDFHTYASHPKIIGAIDEVSAAGKTGGYPGGMGGYGQSGMSGDEGFTEGSSMGGGYPSGGSSMGGGYPSGGSSMGGGYPSGGSSMGGGYPSGGSGMGGGYPSGSSSMGGGYPSGMGGMGGMGGKGDGGGFSEGSSSMGGGYGGGYGGGGYGNPGFAMDMPKKLPSTKYKLVRFFDLKAVPGKVYKYRVRLLMYDPNYPEWAAFKPNSSNLTPEALLRIHDLESKEPKEVAPANPPVSGTAVAVAPTKRISRRESAWSAPSKPILAAKPASVYLARKDEEKPECILVDFDSSRGIYVARKEPVGKEQGDRGMVLGTHRTKAKESIEFIHPTLKVIKALKEYRSATYVSKFVTVVELKGLAPLSMANAKDPLKSGLELVSFDPISGQIVVSREFDNFTSFHMFAQPDLPAVGPLGGGLADGGAGGGGYGGGGYGGGMGGMGGMGMGGNEAEGGGPSMGGGMGMGGKGGKGK